MARVKRAVNAQKKRRVVLERASGLPRAALAALPQGQGADGPPTRSGAYRDRRAEGRLPSPVDPADQRRGARANGMTYNRFIQGLKAAEAEVDRRMLAGLAVNDERRRSWRSSRSPRPTSRHQAEAASA